MVKAQVVQADLNQKLHEARKQEQILKRQLEATQSDLSRLNTTMQYNTVLLNAKDKESVDMRKRMVRAVNQNTDQEQKIRDQTEAKMKSAMASLVMSRQDEVRLYGRRVPRC